MPTQKQLLDENPKPRVRRGKWEIRYDGTMWTMHRDVMNMTTGMTIQDTITGADVLSRFLEILEKELRPIEEESVEAMRHTVEEWDKAHPDRPWTMGT